MDKRLEKHAHRLRPMTMRAQLEREANNLFEDVCCGSRSLWPLKQDELKSQSKARTRFFRFAHQGMWEAQGRFLRQIEGSASPLQPDEEALYRSAMDTIAWQMLGMQLCYARRLYRDSSPPSLTHSNLQSVVAYARDFREKRPDSMPLISDLTTFVQIGDVLASDPDDGILIAEVKEGRKNHEVLALANIYKQSTCEHFRQIVSQTETAQTVRQFERVLRQMDRMKFATDVMNKGDGRDPDSNQEVHIPEPYLPVEEWAAELNETFDDALERGWAINVIDDCVFIGVYASPHMRAASPLVFLSWFNAFADDSSPTARLIDCVGMPLALPIFALPTSQERQMDLLFGRLHVCMGISVPGLVAACEKHGILARPPKNKSERKAVGQLRGESVNYKGQPLILERQGKVRFLAKGLFVRALFHFQRPMSAINAILDATSEE